MTFKKLLFIILATFSITQPMQIQAVSKKTIIEGITLATTIGVSAYYLYQKYQHTVLIENTYNAIRTLITNNNSATTGQINSCLDGLGKETIFEILDYHCQGLQFVDKSHCKKEIKDFIDNLYKKYYDTQIKPKNVIENGKIETIIKRIQYAWEDGKNIDEGINSYKTIQNLLPIKDRGKTGEIVKHNNEELLKWSTNLVKKNGGCDFENRNYRFINGNCVENGRIIINKPYSTKYNVERIQDFILLGTFYCS